MSHRDRRYWLENTILHEYFVTCMWNIDKHWAEYIVEKCNTKEIQIFLSTSCEDWALKREGDKI